MQTTSGASRIDHALISVSNKVGLIPFAGSLTEQGVSILSTEGTERYLREAGVAVEAIAHYIEYPEMMDGDVKIFHPRTIGGVLGRSGIHDKVMEVFGIRPIGLVVVNLDAHIQTLMQPGCTLEEALESMDIGGPTILRAAVKNYREVAVVCDPADYPKVLQEMEVGRGTLSICTRLALAKKALAYTMAYDAIILRRLEGPIYHGMLNGESLCNNPPGLPVNWPSGHRCVNYRHEEELTCPECKAIAAFIRRGELVV